jgi:Na+-transporting methylmalonyl-CoA/oxaloacetate decarboxylase gamma subunit
MNDALTYGFELAGIGLLVVFSVLSLLAIAVNLLQRLDARWQANEKVEHAALTEAPPTIDTTTLVLISAAVFTATQGRGHIKTVRRLMPSEHPNSAWALEGRLNVQGSHYISPEDHR